MTSLTFVRRWLLFWAAVTTVYFIYLNWFGGISAKFETWTHFWHVSWVSVPQTLVLMPIVLALMFGVVPRYGGFGSHMGRAIFFLLAGVISWGGLGNGIFFWKQLAESGETPPYPWWPDLFYIGLVFMWGLGLYYLARSLNVRWKDVTRQFWIPLVGILVTAWLTVPMGSLNVAKIDAPWVLSSWSDLSTEGTFWIFNWAHASLGYLIMDVVLISLALIVLPNVNRVADGMFAAPVKSVVIAVFAMYLGDIMFDYRIVSEKFPYSPGDIATIFYAIAMYTMVYAVYQFGKAHEKLEEAVMEMEAMMTSAAPIEPATIEVDDVDIADADVAVPAGDGDPPDGDEDEQPAGDDSKEG